MTLPLLALFVVFNLVPLFGLAKLSLQRWADVSAGRPAPLTLDNYARMVQDPVFWKVLRNTVVFTVVRVSLGLLIGFWVAVAIQRTRAFRAISIAAWFSPFMTSLVAMAVVFTYLFNPTFGLVDDLLRTVGLPQLRFLSDPEVVP